MEEYTIDQIKCAFWEVFHESGELWFSCFGTEEDKQSYTMDYWNDFVEELKKCQKTTKK